MGALLQTGDMTVAVPSLNTTCEPTPRYDQQRVEFEFVSLREHFNRLTTEDRQRLEGFLKDDPQLERVRQECLASTSSAADLSHELATLVAERMAESLSPRAQLALEPLVDFYFGYRRSFPDPTEIQTLKGIFDMLDHLPKWDAIMARDPEGKIIAACSGQIVDVPCASGDFRISWNEHTWVDLSMRGKEIGKKISAAFEENARIQGAVGTVLEIDNPLLLSPDPRGYTEDKIERKEFWTAEMGLAMDPITRWEFWSKRGYGLICYEVDGKQYPVPYCQISLDLGVVGSCETINQVFKPMSSEYADFLNEERYAALFKALQLTIDQGAAYYPEWIRTHNQILAIPDNAKFSIVPLNAENIYEIFASAGMYKEDYARKDFEYCKTRLAEDTLTSKERHILEQTYNHLSRSLGV